MFDLLSVGGGPLLRHLLGGGRGREGIKEKGCNVLFMKNTLPKKEKKLQKRSTSSSRQRERSFQERDAARQPPKRMGGMAAAKAE